MLLREPPRGAWEANVRITEAPRSFFMKMCVSPRPNALIGSPRAMLGHLASIIGSPGGSMGGSMGHEGSMGAAKLRKS